MRTEVAMGEHFALRGFLLDFRMTYLHC
jgi:hypothetical protein